MFNKIPVPFAGVLTPVPKTFIHKEDTYFERNTTSVLT